MNLTSEETKSTQTYPDQPKYLVGVRINNQVKSEFYDPNDLKRRVGLPVMVNTNQGLKLGVVASNKIINFYKNKDQKFHKVIRVANENDFKAVAEMISDILDSLLLNEGDKEKVFETTRKRVIEKCKAYPIYEEAF